MLKRNKLVLIISIMMIGLFVGLLSSVNKLSFFAKFSNKSTMNSIDFTKSFDQTYSKVEILWLKDDTDDIQAVPNAPDYMGMIPISYNGQNVVDNQEDYNYPSTIYSNQINNTSKWANAKDSKGNVFVWIPRYAYIISYYQNESDLLNPDATPIGYCDGTGIYDSHGNYFVRYNSGFVTKDNKKYIIHEAFNDWDYDLTGIWVSKNSSSQLGVESRFTSSLMYNQAMNSHLIKNNEYSAFNLLNYNKNTKGQNTSLTTSGNITGINYNSEDLIFTSGVGINSNTTPALATYANKTNNTYTSNNYVSIYDADQIVTNNEEMLNFSDGYAQGGISSANSFANTVGYSVRSNELQGINFYTFDNNSTLNISDTKSYIVLAPSERESNESNTNVTHTLTFNGNVPAGVTYSYSGNYEITTSGFFVLSLEVPTRSDTGYSFKCWNTRLDGQGISYDPGSLVPGDNDVTLYAMWEVKSYTISYEKNTSDTVTNMPQSQTKLEGQSINISNDLPVRTGYVFEGWNSRPDGSGIKYLRNELYSDDYNLKLYATWKAGTGIQYKVKYYISDQSGQYIELTNEEITDYAYTGDEVYAPIKTFADYPNVVENLNHPDRKIKGIVTPDGSLVLKVFYSPAYTVTYLPGTQGTFEPEVYSNIALNSATPAFSKGLTSNPGFTFAGWSPDINEYVTDDITYTAQWSANTNVPYVIRYYFEDENGDYVEDDQLVIYSYGYAGQYIEADINNYEGYQENQTHPLRNIADYVNGDGNTELRVYYSRTFLVQYLRGTKGTFEEEYYSGLEPNSPTPYFQGTITGEQGYIFNGWDPILDQTVTQNQDYTAVWVPSTNTHYSICRYLQRYDGTYVEDMTRHKDLYGTTDEYITSSPIDIPDYEFDSSIDGTVLDGEILGDGSFEIRHYYKMLFKVNYDLNTTDTTAYGAPASHTKYLNINRPLSNLIPTRAGYIFRKWNTSPDGTGVDFYPGGTFYINDNTTLYAVWEPSPYTPYTVKYYLPDTQGGFIEQVNEQITRYGLTGTQVEALIKVFDGYSVNQAISTLSDTLKADGTTVLSVYYSGAYTITYLPGTAGTFTPVYYTNLKYLDYTPQFEGTPQGRPGYIFTGWTPQFSSYVLNNVDYVAQWDRATNIPYTTRYFLQDPQTGNYIEDTNSKTTLYGAVDDKVNAVIKPFNGYSPNRYHENSILTCNISYDGSSEMRVYYDLDLTVTYNKGSHGTFEDLTYTDIKWNSYTPTFIGDLTCERGYRFAGWSPSIKPKVTENITYVAQWITAQDVEYTVRYFKLNPETNIYEEVIEDIEHLVGSQNDVVIAPEKAYHGYKKNPNHPMYLDRAVLGADNTTELRVYYEPSYYVYYLRGSHGTFIEEHYNELTKGDDTPLFRGTITGIEGYIFVGWYPEIESKVTDNTVYIAQWVRDPSYVSTNDETNTWVNISDPPANSEPGTWWDPGTNTWIDYPPTNSDPGTNSWIDYPPTNSDPGTNSWIDYPPTNSDPGTNSWIDYPPTNSETGTNSWVDNPPTNSETGTNSWVDNPPVNSEPGTWDPVTNTWIDNPPINEEIGTNTSISDSQSGTNTLDDNSKSSSKVDPISYKSNKSFTALPQTGIRKGLNILGIIIFTILSVVLFKQIKEDEE